MCDPVNCMYMYMYMYIHEYLNYRLHSTCVAGQVQCTQLRCEKTCASIGELHFMTFDGTQYDVAPQSGTCVLTSLNGLQLATFGMA